mmetsp:Transcript_6540/g.20341  ORF Transcript_6540/g.20341 Transcript_6540/m.20341 type:complete len:609 (-) Transcript_6540:209-2035(-)
MPGLLARRGVALVVCAAVSLGARVGTEIDAYGDDPGDMEMELEDDIPEERPEVGPPTAVRSPCEGSLVGGAGNCAQEWVMDEGGLSRMVQLHCFAVNSNAHYEALAGWQKPGECYIPPGSFCSSSRQCRIGTFCMADTSESGAEWACQELPISSNTNGVPEVAGLVQSRAAIMKEALKCSGAHCGRTGILSVFAQAGPSLSPLFDEVYTSFQTVVAESHAETSASNAQFYYSGDKRFIAKKIRGSEYDAMADDLMEDLSEHANLQGKTCSAHDPSCWARMAMESTTLNLPVLAFKHNSDHWVVVPVAQALRAYALTGNPAAKPMVEPKIFDVKPLTARSNQRERFFELLADHNFSPSGSEESEAASEFRRLRRTIFEDAAFLGERLFVDYSLLVEVYSPSSTVSAAGPGCARSQQCFGGESPCTVLCVSIIDYFLKYDSTWKVIESTIISGKWSKYTTKVKTLATCIGQTARLWVLKVKNRNNVAKKVPIVYTHMDDFEGFSFAAKSGVEHRMVNFLYDDGGSSMQVEIFHHFEGGINSRCRPYVSMACHDIPRMHYDVRPHNMRYTKSFICTYNVGGPRARACRVHALLDCFSLMGSVYLQPFLPYD